MLVRQEKSPKAKGSITCTCENKYKDSTFQSAANLNFENFSPGPTTLGSIMNSGYKRMSSILSVKFCLNDQ